MQGNALDVHARRGRQAPAVELSEGANGPLAHSHQGRAAMASKLVRQSKYKCALPSSAALWRSAASSAPALAEIDVDAVYRGR